MLDQAVLNETRAEEVYSIVSVYDYVLQDLPRWMIKHKKIDESADLAFLRFWSSRQEFRSILKYRIKRFGNSELTAKFNKACAGKSYFFIKELHLSVKDIGPGLYVEHGFSTIVFAKSIGANFHVNQNVTIGTGRGGNPVILDNVSVFTGAVVIGGISIGNNVKVGANAVVTDSVPDNATVVPQKSRIILR